MSQTNEFLTRTEILSTVRGKFLFFIRCARVQAHIFVRVAFENHVKRNFDIELDSRS